MEGVLTIKHILMKFTCVLKLVLFDILQIYKPDYFDRQTGGI